MIKVYANPSRQNIIGCIEGDDIGYSVKVFGDEHALDGAGFTTEDEAFDALLEVSGHAQAYKESSGPFTRK